eukprot:sb/3476354/
MTMKPASYIELYNIVLDPSETKNVSTKYPEIVKMLTEKIDGYKATVVAMGNRKKDPASNPANFNNTWMPWMDGEEGERMEGEYSLGRELWMSGNELTEEDLTGCNLEWDQDAINLVEF